jgi:FkbM family methyltransferase
MRPESTKERVVVVLVRALRHYMTHSPFERGRYRIGALVNRLLASLDVERRLVVSARDGRKFSIDPRDPQYHMGLLHEGRFEPEATKVVTESVHAGDVAIDAGANYGWYTTLLSRLVGPDGSVHAFEAMPNTADVLRENCRMNECANVTINQCALGDRPGTTVIYDHAGRASGDASLFPIAGSQRRSHVCEMLTLDDYFRAHGVSRCDFIKCDVEGAELLFLKGASRVLKTHRPMILVEINPRVLQRSGTSGSEVLEEINRDNGYVFQIVGRPQTFIRPSDCESIDTYVNVLCRPR